MNDLNQEKEAFSLSGSLLWCFTLTVGLQIVISFVFTVGLSINGVASDDIEAQFLKPDIMFYTSLIAMLLSIPLFKKASKQANYIQLANFIKMVPIKKQTLIKVFVIGLVYYLFEYLSVKLLGIGTPQYMLDVKSQVNTNWDLILLVITVCIIAPIVEEVIFRGVIFSRLQNSRVGSRGAIVYTSIIFCILHAHYELIIMGYTLLIGVMLAFIRLRTSNIWYCIILHMMVNVFSTIELFLF
jgi:membrane protease YdiL (CAAX protease family)